MEERTIINSTSLWAKRLKKIVIIFLIATIVILPISYALNSVFGSLAHNLYEEHHHLEYGSFTGYYYTKANADWDDYKDKYDTLWATKRFFLSLRDVSLFILLPLSLILLVVYLYSSKMEITVTDKRVFGKVAFGRRVDLPLDSVSAVGTSAFKGLAVATSAGKIRFVGLDRRDELHGEISKLLVDRQPLQTKPENPRAEGRDVNVTDELRKFKELLDSGIITQEEFDAKKKQLLGL